MAPCAQPQACARRATRQRGRKIRVFNASRYAILRRYKRAKDASWRSGWHDAASTRTVAA